jgi:hydroxymethylglutaryl-CoA lyase
METVEIFEVGPRDGLQPEPEFVDTEKKIQLVNMLTDAGCKRIEVTSFVNPKWVPQMRDARELVRGIRQKEGVVYNALVPNMKGFERAVETGLKEVVTIMSTSESHNKKT